VTVGLVADRLVTVGLVAVGLVADAAVRPVFGGVGSVRIGTELGQGVGR
jgi:hypothetical protein